MSFFFARAASTCCVFSCYRSPSSILIVLLLAAYSLALDLSSGPCLTMPSSSWLSGTVIVAPHAGHSVFWPIMSSVASISVLQDGHEKPVNPSSLCILFSSLFKLVLSGGIQSMYSGGIFWISRSRFCASCKDEGGVRSAAGADAGCTAGSAASAESSPFSPGAVIEAL